LGGDVDDDDDDDATAASESEMYDESLAAFIARSTRAWIAQQPQNLRNVTPLLRWPNDKLFALSTLKGTLKNTLAVLLGMVLMTVFLGGADALLLAFQAKFARPLPV
jgi:preprotein translocase subunit SecE